MKRLIMFLIFIAGLILFLVMENKNSVSDTENLTVKQAYELIRDSEGDSSFVLIDVRTPAEYEVEHIDHARLLNFRSENFEKEVKQLPKDKQYLLYCRTGHRSGMAKEVFKTFGLKVQHIIGGITEWKKQGLPVTNE